MGTADVFHLLSIWQKSERMRVKYCGEKSHMSWKKEGDQLDTQKQKDKAVC